MSQVRSGQVRSGQLLPEVTSVWSDVDCGSAGSQRFVLLTIMRTERRPGLPYLSLRVGWVVEGCHRLGDVVAAGYSLQTADGLEESAGPRHSPRPPTVRPGAAHSLLPPRETGAAQVRGRHQGEVRHLQRLEQPPRQSGGEPAHTSLAETAETAEDREEHFSLNKSSIKLKQRARPPSSSPRSGRAITHFTGFSSETLRTARRNENGINWTL